MLHEAKYCINGRFLTRRITGVDRFAREVVREIDGLLDEGEAVLLLPDGLVPIDWEPCSNIAICNYGTLRGHLWEQFDFSHYARKYGLLPVSLCNTAPICNPGVVCIHDMAARANESNYSSRFVAWYRFLYSQITRKAAAILTVSDFSKAEIEKFYPKSKGKISVIPNAWQHLESIESDAAALEKFGLESGKFWFAMSSLAPNKNLRWLVETALLNPSEVIVIAGGVNDRIFGEHDIPFADNVIYLGYVSDSEAKTLLKDCKGFLFPTFYEGFGIPPLEALASGAPIVAVSDTKVMHEVYRDSVAYIDPMRPCASLCDLCGNTTHSIAEVLDSYSWKASAMSLLGILRRVERQHD